MMDPMHSRLAQVRYEEQLREAAEARERRATWVAEPGLVKRLRSAFHGFFSYAPRQGASAAGADTCAT